MGGFPPDRIPWDCPQTLAWFGPEADWDPDRDVGWELWRPDQDFSQARNIKTQHPDKVAELQALWWEEAERNRAAADGRRVESRTASCRRCRR